LIFRPWLALDYGPAISTSWVAGIADMCYHAQLWSNFWDCFLKFIYHNFSLILLCLQFLMLSCPLFFAILTYILFLFSRMHCLYALVSTLILEFLMCLLAPCIAYVFLVNLSILFSIFHGEPSLNSDFQLSFQFSEELNKRMESLCSAGACHQRAPGRILLFFWQLLNSHSLQVCLVSWWVSPQRIILTASVLQADGRRVSDSLFNI
jgi:signal transduction histidine kinase